jgi:hypothetical protein
MSEQPGYQGRPPRFEEALFEPTEAFSWAFALFREEPQRVGLPLVVLGFALVAAGTIIPSLLSGAMGLLAALAPDSLGIVFRGLAHLLSAGVNLLVGAYVCSVGYPFVLNVARGRPVAFADLFLPRPLSARIIVLYFVVTAATAMGTALCVLPGVFCMAATFMAMPLLIDQELAPAVALRRSWELAQRQLLPLLIFCLFCILAVGAGMLLCFVGAVFVSLPVVFLAQAYVYLRLTGETPIGA